ncbi:MAG: long-chain fatty acid--CoA ligase [Candidatus Schekmanbacteria bacterium]|nr:long-chain fatty acid--CoA ligase [Candidatus Schekmanbacteria bacterium]
MEKNINDSQILNDIPIKRFINIAKKHAVQSALLYEHVNKYHSISYNEFLLRVSAFAAGLKKIGASKGDRLAIIHANSPEWIICDLACLALGVVDIPLYKSITNEQLTYIINQCAPKFFLLSNYRSYRKIMETNSEVLKETKFIIAEKPNDIGKEIPNLFFYDSVYRMGLAEVEKGEFSIDEAALLISADDDATIIYTSGTTGQPKGVVITNRNIVSEIDGLYKAIETKENDSIISFLPLSHVLARLVDYFIIFSGRTIAYSETMEALAKNLVEIKPTLLVGVPRVYDKLYSAIRDAAKDGYAKALLEWGIRIGERWNSAADRGEVPALLLRVLHFIADRLIYSRIREKLGGNIRILISGGAPLRRDVATFFRNLGLVIQEGYGLTETCCAVTLNRKDRIKIGTVGEAVEGAEIKIAENNEILIRGPMIMKGYYRNETATSEVIDKEGWLHTGDAGFIDTDGYITINDRIKELIKTSSGKYVAPQKLEHLLTENSMIANAAIIGDGRKFISALIVPEKKFISGKAQQLGLSALNNNEFLNNQSVTALYKSLISDINRNLESHEKIKSFRLLENDFSVEGGELTPTLKLRRKIISEKYGYLIESIYEGFD